MEIEEAERKTFDELKSNYRQALISNYHDLVQLGNLLKKDLIHKQIVATANDYDLMKIKMKQKVTAGHFKNENSSWREYLIIMMKC